jgi:ATP-binding cassette subfamily C protein CydC
MNALQPLLRIVSLWRGRTVWLVAGLLVTLAALGTGVGLMVMSAGLLRAALLGVAIGVPMAVVVVLGPARVVLRYLERLVTHAALFRALGDLRVWFFRGLATHGAGSMGFRQTGDLLSRIMSDIEAMDAVYMRVLLPLAGAVLLLPVTAILVGRDGVILVLIVTTLLVLVAFVLPLLSARAAIASGSRLAAAQSGLRVACLDMLTGLREVRAFGAEGRVLAQMQARESQLFTAQHERSRAAARITAGALLCGQAALAAVLLLPGPHALASIFLVVAVFEALGLLPLAGLLGGQAVAAATRLVASAEGPVELPDPAVPAALPRSSALRFEAVGYRYRPDRAAVLDGLTLDIPAGSRVAILGPSGAGKSTLAALALKVAAPQSGRILLGGVDIATLAAADLRTRIAWLGQTTHLFDDSIAANLRLVRPDADEAALWTALEQAQIADLVRALPDGLDSQIGEGGLRVSGGQGRRLALARTLLSDAPVLILDEPCAGLDAQTEREFLATLNETAQGRTVVLITHRLTGVERLDWIFRLSGGRAVAAAA